MYTDGCVLLLNSGAKNHHHISLIPVYASSVIHLSGPAQAFTSVRLFSTPQKSQMFSNMTLYFTRLTVIL